MTEQQTELKKLIDGIDDLWYTETYHKVELPEAEYLKILTKQQTENRQALYKIEKMLENGVSLDFTDHNNQSVMDWAVTQNSVELIEILIKYSVRFQKEHLCRAATFGADRVIKFLIEEQGISPVRKSSRDYSVLACARSSRHSRNVLPYLIEVLKKYKNDRMPPPKKPKDLTEENIRKHLPNLDLKNHHKQKLDNLIDSIFVEEYSVSMAFFYESIAEQDPDIVFACIDLMNQATTTPPKDKTTKKINWTDGRHLHHGNLVIEGKLDIRSLMVTGNLTVKGEASNVQGRTLFVGGNFDCKSFYTEGPVVIGGNLVSTQVHAYYNDYTLEVKQTLKADTLLIKGYHLVKAKIAEVKNRIEQ
jgi:cytoskeletal protein CcmA (bactofilin family)